MLTVVMIWLEVVFRRLSEWKGRLIAYIGGGGISIVSSTSSVKAQVAAEHLPSAQATLTTANVISIVGLIFVGFRLAFDVYVYINSKRKESEQNRTEQRES
ncbi:hypothetical protein [Vibrio litoralis]|uniref:hypothetical protein n=1 Tax=Vibrio litoralis TaxID=335972 RepID=UPI000487C807|nr:hypothetical protein [Vibrio litoralis]